MIGPAKLRARGPRNNQTDPGQSRKQSKKSPKTIKNNPTQSNIIKNNSTVETTEINMSSRLNKLNFLGVI